MWHWANEVLVPRDPLDPTVERDARQRLVDAITPPVRVEPARPERAASNGSNGAHHPGLAPSFRAPSWWKGDRAAFSTSVQAAADLGYRGKGLPNARPGRARRR